MKIVRRDDTQSRPTFSSNAPGHWRARIDERPVPREVVFRLENFLVSYFIDQKLTDLLLLVIDNRRTVEHRVSAAASLAVIVERESEAVCGSDRLSLEGERRDPRADRACEIDRVI